MISSIVPIKNKVETVNELSTQLRKGVITDSDGYTNIRKSNSVNSEIIGKIVDREVFIIGKQMIIGILCKLQKE